MCVHKAYLVTQPVAHINQSMLAQRASMYQTVRMHGRGSSNTALWVCSLPRTRRQKQSPVLWYQGQDQRAPFLHHAAARSQKIPWANHSDHPRKDPSPTDAHSDPRQHSRGTRHTTNCTNRKDLCENSAEDIEIEQQSKVRLVLAWLL